MAGRQSAYARPRGTGLPRRPLPPARLRGVGRALVRRPSTCPATACCSRRSARCSACACWARSPCSPRWRCSNASRPRPTAARRAGASSWFAVAAVGDMWSRATRLRARRLVRARRRARARARGARSRRALLAALCAAASPVAGALLALGALTLRARPARAAGAARARRARGGCRARACAAVSRRRLRAVSDPLVPRDGAGRARVPVGAAAGRSRCCASVRRCICSRACCAFSSTRRWAATSSATACCSPARCCCALLEPRAERGRRCRAVRWRRAVVGRCGGRCARRSRSPAANRRAPLTTLPSKRFLAATHAARAPGGAADALALGGRAARADGLARARAGRSSSTSAIDGVLLAHGLTAAVYDSWLHEQAVDYVALPDTPLDPSSAQEGRLIDGGLPYLREVFASRHWRIYRGALRRRRWPRDPAG